MNGLVTICEQLLRMPLHFMAPKLLMMTPPTRRKELGPITLQHDDAENCMVKMSGVHRWAEIGEWRCGSQVVIRRFVATPPRS